MYVENIPPCDDFTQIDQKVIQEILMSSINMIFALKSMNRLLIECTFVEH